MSLATYTSCVNWLPTLVKVTEPKFAVRLSKLPATYTLAPLTASAVAPSLPLVPPAACAHPKLPALVSLATNTLPLPALVRAVDPKLAVGLKNVPATYTLVPLVASA